MAVVLYFRLIFWIKTKIKIKLWLCLLVVGHEGRKRKTKGKIIIKAKKCASGKYCCWFADYASQTLTVPSRFNIFISLSKEKIIIIIIIVSIFKYFFFFFTKNLCVFLMETESFLVQCNNFSIIGNGESGWLFF